MRTLIKTLNSLLRFAPGHRRQLTKAQGWRCPDIHYQFELFARFGDSGAASQETIINHLILRKINLGQARMGPKLPSASQTSGSGRPR